MVRRLFYRAFRLLSGIQHRMRRRFTPAGLLALGALVASAVVGLDTNQTLAYQAFAFLAALFAISLAWSARVRPRAEARRVLPRFGSAGAPVAYRVLVRNPTGRPQAGLTVLEDFADPRPSFEEFSHAPEPGQPGYDWLDRAAGYSRWVWLVARRRGAVVPEQTVPALGPRGEGEVRVELTPSRRGFVRFAGLTLARPDPFGLSRALTPVPLPQSLLVLPKRYPVPPVQLPGRRKFQQGGVALAGSVGDSEEFVALRDYRPGDPLRRIHWKSWARVGKPIVKEYQDEFFVRHALVLDTFLLAESDLFEDAVSVAASFAYAMPTQESLLDLLFVGPEAYCFTAGRGVGPVDRMLEILACVGVCRDKPFRTLHQLVVSRCASLSGCVVVLVAWDEARRAFADHLAALGVPALVLLVTDPRRPGTADLPGAHVRRLQVGRIAEGLAAL